MAMPQPPQPAHRHAGATVPASTDKIDHASHTAGHAGMVDDYRRRFFVSFALTIPVLALSPTIQGFVGLGDRLAFNGSEAISLVLSAIIFLYGGWPFLTGFVDELRTRRPGMMTLIA